MPDAEIPTPKPLPLIYHPRRNRSRALTISCALVVVIACVIGFKAVAYARYKVSGPEDPASNYRIEYTVSSRYRRSHIGVVQDISSFGENEVLTPSPPPRVIEWLQTHILHIRAKPSDLAAPFLNLGTVTQTTGNNSLIAESMIDGHGNPELQNINGFARGAVEEHLMVSGCRATFYTCSTSTLIDRGLTVYVLLVEPRDQHAAYEFWAVDDPVHPTGTADELVKIKDSIRITKVK
jgi:hypothetical protein